MRIILLQTDIKWADPQANCQHAEQMIAEHPGGDLYVLPEMFSTGFATSPEGVAEKEGTSLRWMQETAKRLGIAICGSIATETNEEYRNRLYFVYPDGKEKHYDKRHLFSYGGEDKQYSRGEERVVVEYCDVRILLQICYDLRFPVFARNQGDYDMIIYVANWPTSRLAVWKTLLHARAIENQCYVAGVNRCGTDNMGCEYSGGTMLIDAYGRDVAESCYGHEDVAEGLTDMKKLRAFRSKFPVLDDRD